MADVFRIDSHKLMFHPQRVTQWLESYGKWEEEKRIYPIYVEVSPYGGCNHRCTFCGVDYMGYKSIKIDLSIYKERIQEMARLGVKSVMFAGEGEPFLHKELPLMVEATKRAGIDAAITTNFVLANAENLPLILECASWVKVSINAGESASYAKIHRTKEADFNKVLKNLELALAIREDKKFACTLGAQMLLLPENYKEALILAQRLKNIGVDYLVIKPYSQHLFSKTREYEAVDYKEFYYLKEQLESLSTERFNVVFRAETMQASINGQGYQKCYSTPYFWAYIASNGDVYGCSCYLGQKNFAYGNINAQSFQAIWEGDRRKENARFIQQELDISKCRINCRMDFVNRYLWELKHPNLHNNFI